MDEGSTRRIGRVPAPLRELVELLKSLGDIEKRGGGISLYDPNGIYFWREVSALTLLGQKGAIGGKEHRIGEGGDFFGDGTTTLTENHSHLLPKVIYFHMV